MGVKGKKSKSLLKDIFTDEEISRAKKVEPFKKTSNSKVNSKKLEIDVKKDKLKKENKDVKPKKVKWTVLEKKERREHAMVIVLTVFIVLLILGLGYSVYNYYQTKSDAHAEISDLNNTILNLSEDKNQLILNLGNLTNEIDSLNQTVKLLTADKASLIAQISGLKDEVDDLESELDSLQETLDDCEVDLDVCEDDLSDCEDSL